MAALQARIQLDIDGVWTTLADRLLVEAGVNSSVGRKDEQSVVAPGTCTVRARNHDGALTLGDPGSSLWPHNDLDTGARVQVNTPAGWVTRFTGAISALNPVWPAGSVTGLAEIDMEIAGELRRWRNADPLQSALRRHMDTHLDDPRLVAYWPLEDGRDSERAVSPLPDVEPMLLAMRAAADDSLASSAPLPSGNAPWGFNGRVPSSVINWLWWRVEWALRVPEPPTAGNVLLMSVPCTGSSPYTRIDFYVSSFNVLLFQAVDGNGNIVGDDSVDAGAFFDDWCFVRLGASRLSSSTIVFFSVFQEGDLIATASDTFSGGVTGRPARVQTLATVNTPQAVSMGHVLVRVEPTIPIMVPADPFLAWKGETAATRFARLTAENDVASQVVGTTTDSPAMGPQRVDRLAAHLDECARIGGVTYESLDTPRMLEFRTRESLHNQTALDVDTSVTNPLAPARDTQQFRNRITASRPQGSSVTLPDPGHITRHGPHDWSVSVNSADERDLPHHAGWWLHLGTQDDPRHPSVTIRLTRVSDTLLADLLAVRQGDRLIIPESALPPEHHGPIDILVEGWHEQIGDDWTIRFNASPAQPWETGIWDDRSNPGSGHGRWDSRTTQTDALIDDDDTSLDVVTLPPGRPWVNSTDHPGEFPIDISAPATGEEMTVTAATQPTTTTGYQLPLASDDFERTETGTWGDASDGHTWIGHDVFGTITRSVNAGAGHLAMDPAADPTANSANAIGDPALDMDLTCGISADTLPGVGEIIQAGAELRADLGLFHAYGVVIVIDNTGDVGLSAYIVGPGGQQSFPEASAGITYTADDILRLRVRIEGDQLQARVWEDGDPEPGTWLVDETVPADLRITQPGVPVLRAEVESAVTVSYHDMTAVELVEVTEQTLTVTRAANNTTAKTLPAGSEVRLTTDEALFWASPKGVT